MTKDARRVIHLFKSEEIFEQSSGSPPVRRTLNGLVSASACYYWNTKTLCGMRAALLFAFTTKQLKEIPLDHKQERFCRRCLGTKDGALRLLQTV